MIQLKFKARTIKSGVRFDPVCEKAKLLCLLTRKVYTEKDMDKLKALGFDVVLV